MTYSNPLISTFAWWLALALLGLGAWPLLARLCRGLPDRGYLLARAVGWLGVGYALWLGASLRLLSNQPPAALALSALLLALGGAVAYRNRRALRRVLRARGRLLLWEEVLFSGALLAFVLVRALNPDLWQPWFGGEKMMEIAYLNAITRSVHFPPYDPFFAGGTINYYYYGLYLVNVLCKLTGIAPEVAFNLAVPTFFALTVGLAFSFGHALGARVARRRGLLVGLAAAAGVALAGNLTVLVQTLGGLVALGGGEPSPQNLLAALPSLVTGAGRWLSGQGNLPAFDYWYQATRVIPYTINEFPFFSYLFADLHPHMMAIPFTIAVLVVLVGVPRLGSSRSGLLLLALVLGALGPLNTWDLPTYLGLAALVIVYQAVVTGAGWGPGALAALAAAGLSFVLYLPYYEHYTAPSAAPVFWPNRTGLRYFLVVWGLWLFLLYSWLLVRWWRGRDGAHTLSRLLWGPRAARRRELVQALGAPPTRQVRARRLTAAAGVGLAVLALAAGEGVLALLFPLMALAADLCLRQAARPAERLAGALALAGAGILAVTEMFFLSDFLRGGEWQRMNTVFKFGIQAWVLLALAAAAGVPRLLDWLTSRRGGGRLAWALAALLLGAASLAYVPLGIAARVQERFPGGPPPVGTLDGLAYMEAGVYHWPDEQHPIVLRHDREAIAWLNSHVQGTPVIAEAPIGYYREGGGRVAAYTGLPTLVGMHQVEQRPAALVAERTALAESLYRSVDPEETLAILQQLDVRYIYVGQLEEAAYGPGVRATFDALVARGDLTVAYQNEAVVIYERPGQ